MALEIKGIPVLEGEEFEKFQKQIERNFMKPALLKMVAIFLKDYSEVLSNNGCNDISDEISDIIDGLGADIVSEFVNEYCSCEQDNDNYKYDWILVGALSKWCEARCH
jgi:hypothetical protein